MIRVAIARRPSDGAIVSFQIEGHAYAGQPGHDLVCAAVSAISVGIVNAVEGVARVVLGVEMEPGWLYAVVPSELDSEQAARAQIILESMVVMLDTIVQSYGEYIEIVTKGG